MAFLRRSIARKEKMALVPSLALLAILLTISSAMAANPLSAQRKSELTNLVRQDCGSCHGMTMKGGLGKPLLPGNLSDASVQEIAQIILSGVPGTPMPPWGGLLAKSDALWIATQLKNGEIRRGNAR